MIEPIINLHKTKEEAMFFKNSPINSFYDFTGVHLIPNTETLYIQCTNVLGGINLEDWIVNVVGSRTGKRYDVSSSFEIGKIFNDLSGSKQFYWGIKNIPYDFGTELAYLEITQVLGETFYSTPFVLTEEDKEWTSVFHYKDRKKDEYQCIGFKTWFREEDYKEEREQYYELSSQNTITHAIKQHDLQIYCTENFAKSQIIQLAKLLGSSYLYIEYVRAYLYEPMDIPRLALQENYTKKINYILSLNKKDIYNPKTIVQIKDFSSLDFNNIDFN